MKSLANCSAVGGADEAPVKRAEWEGLGAGPAFRTIEELLERTRPDVLVIATPPALHHQHCLQGLAAGAHLLCEKPFVENSQQANEVLDAAAAAQRLVAVNHEFRYMPIFADLAAQLRRADVGRPVFLHCTQFMDLAPWEEKVPWRAAMPDRALFEGGVHLVDLFHLLAGRLPSRVLAMTSSGLDPSRRADAIHLVSLDYGDGLIGQITIDRLCRAGTRYADLRVDCERASLRASFGGRASVRVGFKRAERPGLRVDFGPEGMAWAERGLKRSVFARNARGATARATQALYEEAVPAFREGREPPTTARIAADTLRIIEAAYQSAATGQRVELAASGC